MRGAGVLAVHSLSRMRGLLVGIGIVLAFFEFLLTQVAVFLVRSQAFGMLSSLVPGYLQAAAGPSMFVFLSFSGVVLFGYFHPIVIAALVGLAIAIGTEPALEVETRFVDLALARPVARQALVTRAVLVLVVCGIGVLAAMISGTWIGLACCTPAGTPRPRVGSVLSLAANLALLAWCWGGVALAVASCVRRRAVASSLTGVSALAMFLLDYLGRVWEPARTASLASPFHYFEPMPVMAGAGLNVRHAVMLFAIGLVATAIAYARFGRRDL
jgi:ABC-2 type transport system permease protein